MINGNNREFHPQRQAQAIRNMRYAYSSMCGIPGSVSVFSSVGRGFLRAGCLPELFSRLLRCDKGCVTGRLVGNGGVELMLSKDPMIKSPQDYPSTTVSAGAGETL